MLIINLKKLIFLNIIISFNQHILAYIPIQFSIPEIKIVKNVPKKDKDFAFIIPGVISTYIYTQEEAYYADYQRSYFALTFKKGGWDCMRHYEILANGCIPYFIDLDKCPIDTMPFFPKELIQEAMNLEGVKHIRKNLILNEWWDFKGVEFLKIDHTKFNKEKYYEILEKLLAYTQNYLTTRAIASYFLKTIKY